jgi:hypothetical protein
MQIVNTGCVAMYELTVESFSNPVDNPVTHVIKVDNLVKPHKEYWGAITKFAEYLIKRNDMPSGKSAESTYFKLRSV